MDDGIGLFVAAELDGLEGTKKALAPYRPAKLATAKPAGKVVVGDRGKGNER